MRTEPTGTPLPVLAEAAWDLFGEDSTMLFEGRRLTSAEQGAQARRLATGLAAQGVRRGDRVVVCMANCPEVSVAYHACWRLGAVATPVLFLLSEAELRHVVSDAGARLLVTTPELLPKVRAAADDVPVVVTGEPVPGTLSFQDLCGGGEHGIADLAGEDLAALLYTGGTTGRSKGVMVSHDALSAAAWATVSRTVEDHQDVSLLPLPLAHVFGLMVSTMAVHAVRPTQAVLMRWFEPTGWLELAQAERVQVGAVVPTMLRMLAEQPLEDYDLSHLRRLSSGSAPLPPDVLAELGRRLPHVEVGEGYGCTETSASATSSPTGAVRDGSVGTAVPGVDLRIEAADGSTAGPGDNGEICVRGACVTSGYWNSPVETAEALRDGWFHTGDVGHLDEDGYLFVVDRLKDVIIRDGFNVYPRDVEEAVAEHPDVAACAVVGRPDERHGEEVVAWVQLRPGAEATPGELREFARARLSAVKYPRDVHLVDALPLTSIGKLDRKALRRLA